MCWMCGPNRPTDGPEELKLRMNPYSYKIGSIVYEANEDADWEGLMEFPDFQSEFFISRPSSETDETNQEWDELHPKVWGCYNCEKQVKIPRGNNPPEKCRFCNTINSYTPY